MFRSDCSDFVGIPVDGPARVTRALAERALKHAHGGLLAAALFWTAIGSVAIAAYLVC